MTSKDHAYWMLIALEQADQAASDGDVPVGCVILDGEGNLLAKGRNRREADQDPTAHAEIVAIRNAAQIRRRWMLADCTLYVTLEPCPMCAGAIVNARIRTLVFGCSDPKAGAVRSLMQIADDARLNHRAKVIEGIEAEACTKRLRDFFSALRKQGKK